METNITIMLPVHPTVFGIFLGILVAALVYYVVKFIASVITGG